MAVKCNAPRRTAFASARVVQTRFTPLARPDRYDSLTLYGPLAAEAMRKILTRLQLQPGEVRVRGTALGDVALLAEGADGAAQPVAFVDGLTKDEVCQALAELAAEDWRPGRPVLSFVERFGVVLEAVRSPQS